MTITTAERAELEASLAQLQTDIRVADQTMIEWRAEMDDTQPHDWSRLYRLGAEVSQMRTRIAAITEMLATYPVEPDPEPIPAAVDLDQLIRGTEMTAAWFDEGVHRALCAGLKVYQPVDGSEGVYAVSSQSLGTLHATTRTSCTCNGFYRWSRCLHVALLIATLDAFREQPLPNPIHSGTRLTVRGAVAA